MWWLVIGVLGVVLKLLDFGPVANMAWWIILIPFALAVVWCTWADASGYTKRKVMQREDERRQARIDRQRSKMGTLDRSASRRR